PPFQHLPRRRQGLLGPHGLLTSRQIWLVPPDKNPPVGAAEAATLFPDFPARCEGVLACACSKAPLIRPFGAPSPRGRGEGSGCREPGAVLQELERRGRRGCGLQGAWMPPPRVGTGTCRTRQATPPPPAHARTPPHRAGPKHAHVRTG